MVRDSPAPGCVKRIGISPMGGCFGKTAILDLAVEPQVECLSVTVNNCNGGILEVQNGCAETLVLGGARVEPQNSVGLDIVLEGDQYALIEVYNNFSEYVPEVDERIELVGTLGERSLRVAFTKMAMLCE
ncbi:MAG: hypothetical protein JXA14_06040 [Anaerolineae bacterium]|nr:hypothetical protein [Anaerolineae bacterium]